MVLFVIFFLIFESDKKKFSSDKLRAIAANIASYANKNNLKSISLDAKSLELSKRDNLQSLCEGLVLGSYEFLNYKSKVENENSLLKDDVDLIKTEDKNILNVDKSNDSDINEVKKEN